jgi:hypothetical protein
MSELETSREDRFFGVSYQVPTEPEPKEEAAPEVELEIIDDLPRKPAKADAKVGRER